MNQLYCDPCKRCRVKSCDEESLYVEGSDLCSPHLAKWILLKRKLRTRFEENGGRVYIYSKPV